nr:immunoglobulin light chain junction region [Macaca mulatta]MOW62486.1 immunoglobulin light chain junction region [Macaca mulatta]MOW62958.1 immunoglobulin light chain junction region [Macaca mulatta]
CMQGVEFPLTF